MNGLCSSNIMELRVEDLKDAENRLTIQAYSTFTNSRYKTSPIYEEKAIVLCKNLFSSLKLCQLKVKAIFSQSSND